jgi:hydrogenase maturation protease
MSAQVRIIGIGSPLGDDRAGWEAAAMLDAVLPREFAGRGRVAVEILDRPGARLVDRLNGAETLIIVDAAKSGGVPGSIYRFSAKQLGAMPGGVSSHGFGVAQALSLAGALGADLRRVTVYGIEVDPAHCGESISAAVRDALPQLAVQIMAELAAPGSGATRPAVRTPA